MSKNISFMGADYSDVPAIILPQTGGGTARFDDASVTTAVAGDVAAGKIFLAADGTITTGTGSSGGGLVHIASLDDEEITMEDTDFHGWTPSTTAKVIIPAADVGTFVASNIADNDYFIHQRGYSAILYTDSSNSKGKFIKTCMSNWYAITRRPSNNANYSSGTKNANYAESVTNTYAMQYYNSGYVLLSSSAYGIYPTNSAPTVSSTSAASPTITVNRMIINAKCNATYFSTAWAAKVDQANTKFKFKYDIYRAESGYMRQLVYGALMDMWLNGLTVVIPE